MNKLETDNLLFKFYRRLDNALLSYNPLIFEEKKMGFNIINFNNFEDRIRQESAVLEANDYENIGFGSRRFYSRYTFSNKETLEINHESPLEPKYKINNTKPETLRGSNSNARININQVEYGQEILNNKIYNKLNIAKKAKVDGNGIASVLSCNYGSVGELLFTAKKTGELFVILTDIESSAKYFYVDNGIRKNINHNTGAVSFSFSCVKGNSYTIGVDLSEYQKSSTVKQTNVFAVLVE